MSMPLADVRFRTEGPLVCAFARGDIDMSNAAELRRELSAGTPNEALGLILDLSEVGYLDSAGIHLIHHLRADLQAGGQTLVLVLPAASPVNATLRLAGIDWRDQTRETVEAAKDVIVPKEQPDIEAQAHKGRGS